jgi:hypothetical protein
MLLRPTLRAALIALLALPFAAQAFADAAADTKKEIQKLYMKRDAAAQKKDVNGALSAYSPDFVYIAKDGQKGGLKVLKKKLIPLFALMQSVKATTAVQSFALKGKDATATVKEHLEMLVVNPNTQVPQKFVADAVSEDLWTKTGQGWLQKRSKTKTEKASLDGKSIDDKLDLSEKPAAGHPNGKIKVNPPKRVN